MNHSKPTRGSVLIVALIFAGLIAISLTSYMKLALTSSRLANRSFYGNAAENLVDTGLEQALWSVTNSSFTGTSGFTLRSGYTTQYQGTFTPPPLSQGVTGQIKVWVDNNSTSPHAIAKAIITLGDGTTLIKEAEVYMSRRSYFTNGMVAKQSLTFKGNNITVDAWNSDPDASSSTPAVAYSSSVATDNGPIASLSVQVDSITLGNADIYGYASVGGNSSSDISVGPNGRVGPYGTANGVIDPSRVTYDFTTSFPDATYTAPVTPTSLGAVNTSITLPSNTTTDAKQTVNGVTTYYYNASSISLTNKTLAVTAGYNVVINVTDTTGTTISVGGGSGSIVVNSTTTATGSLVMYTAGDVKIAGNGASNTITSTGAPQQPLDFQIYGTRSATTAASTGMQDIQIAGNGSLSAVVYAPNGNITINGNADTYGAMVGNQVTTTGNGAFHYDQSLATTLSTSAWSVSKWRELTTSTDRAAYDTYVSF